MKKKLFSLALLSAISIPAFADGLYGSFSIGNAASTDITGEGKTASSLSYALLLGYEFNKYFSEEIGYTSLLSNASMSGYPANNNAKASSDGLEVAAIASWPVSEQLSIFGRVGYAVHTFTGSLSWGGYTTKNLNGLVFGPGIRVNIDKDFDIRAGYNIYTLNGTSHWAANGNAWTGNGNAVINNNYITGTYHF
jgi:hypothetical protein